MSLQTINVFAAIHNSIIDRFITVTSNCDGSIDWGDGSSESIYSNIPLKHKYGMSGENIIRIEPTLGNDVLNVVIENE